jgi:3-oxoacyl-[acyl-carrier protein] reductase
MEPLEPDDEDWFRAYELLVMSVVRVVQEAAPHLRSDGGGTITMVTSKVIKEASEDNVLSSSVRMAVAGYAKALSKKLAPEVRTNIVLPGAHETPRLNDYDESTRSTVVENIPINRLGNPQELGDMVAYLSSPRSGFTNGEAIILDGGSGKSTF